MLAEQLATAASTARSVTHIDNLARLLWRGVAEGHVKDSAAEAVSATLEARRAILKGPGRGRCFLQEGPASAPRRRPVSPDRRRSIERRRRLAASGMLPAKLAGAYTQAEVAVLAVIGREMQRRGRCELAIDQVAAFAGCSRTLVQGALRLATRLGLVTVTERRRPGRPSDTNVIEVTSSEWRTWLRLGRTGRVQKAEHDRVQVIQDAGDKPRLFPAYSFRSGRSGAIFEAMTTTSRAGGTSTGSRSPHACPNHRNPA